MNEPPLLQVYRIEVCGKLYVGVSGNPTKRYKDHARGWLKRYIRRGGKPVLTILTPPVSAFHALKLEYTLLSEYYLRGIMTFNRTFGTDYKLTLEQRIRFEVYMGWRDMDGSRDRQQRRLAKIREGKYTWKLRDRAKVSLASLKRDAKNRKPTIGGNLLKYKCL